MAPAEELFRQIAREQDRLRDEEGHKERLKAALAGRAFVRPKSSWKARVGWAGLGLAAAAVVALVLRFVSDHRLDATFSGGTAKVGASLKAPPGQSLPVQFSDGSVFELQPETRARLVEIHENGAHVALETGAVRVSVKKSENARWNLTMGPYEVRVTGTRFFVSYEPESENFRLALEEGSVELAGCMFGKAHVVHPGQVARASCRRSTLEVTSFRYDQAAEKSEPVDTAAFADEPEPVHQDDADPSVADDEPFAKNGAVVVKRKGSWQVLARERKYSDALDAAIAAGFEKQCEQAGVDDLILLANAARYSGDVKRATWAMNRIRARFPGSNASAFAAFSLGVMAFDSRASYGEAARWFRTYLSEQPGGALAREARGRLMEAVHRQGVRDEARTLAKRYLAEHPEGPHAKLARRLVETSQD